MNEIETPYVIYTIHFEPALGRFRHYVGSARTTLLPDRLRAHAHGYGARLTTRAAKARCKLVLVHLQPAEARDVERKLKRAGHHDKRCFLCHPDLETPPYVAELQGQLDLLEPPAWQPFAYSLA